jgi:hypothetical protein
VGVDEERAGQLAQQLDLAVGLRLGAREPVAVHVEAVHVAARVELAAVGVLDRQQHDDGVVEDLPRGAVVPVGQLVQDAQRGVGAGLLAPVDVRRHPQDRRIPAGDGAGLARRGARVAQALGGVRDAGERAAVEAVAVADDRPAQLAALPAPLVERARDHALARAVDGVHVRVGLIGRDLAALAAGGGHDVFELGHLAAELRLRLHRVAGGLGGGRGGQDEEGGGREAEQSCAH